jgi:hypothetical protein
MGRQRRPWSAVTDPPDGVTLLGRVCKRAQPQADSRQLDHGQVLFASFLVSGRDAAELLQPVHQALHPVAHSVEGAIEPPRARLIASGRDDRTDLATTQRSTHRAAAVRLVADQGAGPTAGTPTAVAAEGAAVHQRVKDGGFVSLPRRQHERQRLTPTFGAHVKLGREAALAGAEPFRFWVPPLAPAACWCARTTPMRTTGWS